MMQMYAFHLHTAESGIDCKAMPSTAGVFSCALHGLTKNLTCQLRKMAAARFEAGASVVPTNGQISAASVLCMATMRGFQSVSSDTASSCVLGSRGLGAWRFAAACSAVSAAARAGISPAGTQVCVNCLLER
jgi:hypothetical protein